MVSHEFLITSIYPTWQAGLAGRGCQAGRSQAGPRPDFRQPWRRLIYQAQFFACKLACIAGQIEAGSGLDVEGSRTRPADILVHNWEFGKPAALDFTITSPLNPSTLSVMAGSNSASICMQPMMKNATAWAGFVFP